MIVARRLLILVAALFAASCGQESVSPFPKDKVVELSPQFTGDFSLIDKNGAAKTDEDFAGKVMLVYFGFTNCPDICPTDIGVMSAALNELGDAAEEIAPVFISVDPERDTPDALRDYFAFDDRIIPLTGSVEAANEARQGFKLYAQKEELPDSALGYTINHQQAFFITDREGQPQYVLLGGTSVDDLAAVLQSSIKKF